MKKRNGLAQPSYRYNPGKVEVRQAEGSEEKRISGYAAVFERDTNLGWMTESIAKGAFDNVMDNDVRCLFNHDANMILGRTTSKTCTISTDDTGLRYENLMSMTSPISLHVMDSISRGDVTQSSFAFSIDSEQWEKRESKEGFQYWHRTILSVRTLYDVSPVVYPAYEDATVEELSASLEAFCQREMPEQLKEVREARNKYFHGKIEDMQEQMEGASKESYARMKRQLDLFKFKITQ